VESSCRILHFRQELEPKSIFEVRAGAGINIKVSAGIKLFKGSSMMLVLVKQNPQCALHGTRGRRNISVTPQLVAIFFCYPVVNILFVDNG